MGNRHFIGYTLGPLERNVRGRLFDSEGKGLLNFVWTDNLFSAWARPGNLFSCGTCGLGKIYFRVNMVLNHSPLETVMLLKAVHGTTEIYKSSFDL